MKEFVLPEELMRFSSRRQWGVRRGKMPFSSFFPNSAAKSNDPAT